MNDFIKIAWRFVLLVALQTLLLNNVSIKGFAVPLVYVWLLLALPITFPKWANLIVGLLLGLSIDIFTRTVGMHAGACVLLGFVRPYLLNFLSPRDGYEFGSKVAIADQGLNWYMTYVGIGLFIHHTYYFALEAFAMGELFTAVLRGLSSTLFTLIILVISQFFFHRHQVT